MRIVVNTSGEFIVITEDNNVCSLVGGKPERAPSLDRLAETSSPSKNLIATCAAITDGLRKAFPARSRAQS